MSQLLQPVFTQLWHSDPNVRLQSSVQLIGHLEAAQKAAVAPHASNATTDTEAEQEQLHSQLDAGLAPDVSYTLKRLIRGLASPRESSRIGFAVALTELLSRIPDILPRQVYPLLKSSSEIATGSKGSEERDLLFARLFGIHAIVASGFLFRPTSSLYDWRVAIEELFYLGERKTWLRESAGWVIQGATRQLLQRDDVEWKNEALQVLVETAFKSTIGKTLEWTPERLALAILLQQAGIEADWQTITKPAFAAPQLLSSKENLSTIARILRGLSADETSKKANELAQASYLGTTQLHFVWTEILNVYYGSSPQPSTSGKAKVNGQTAQEPVPFIDFYKTVIDGNLFVETASIPIKYIGLLAFKACLITVDAATLPELFTQNVLRTLMNHLAKGDRTLHGIAMQIAKTIPTVAQAHQAVAYDILLKLYQPPIGNVRFDAMTRTKVTEGLVAALDAEGIKKYTNWLISFIIQGDQRSSAQTNGAEDDADMEEEDADAQAKLVENKRLWAIDQLGLLIRKHAKALPVDSEAATALSSPEYSWITRILQFLIVSGFTKVLKTTKKSDIEALRYKSEEPFSNSLQASIRSRFFAALSHLVTANTKCRSEPWLKLSLDTLLALQMDTKHVSPLTSEETVENVKPAVKLLSRVKSLDDSSKAQYLSLLIEVLVLLSFDQTADAEDYMEQMSDAVEAIIAQQSTSSSKATTSKQAADDSDEGEEAEPVSVLVDLLVTLMQRSSVLLRTVSERVFAAASGDVAEQALQLLLDQIIPESFEVEEGDEDEEEEDSDAEDADEGAEAESSTKGKKRKQQEMDEEASDDSDDEEDEDDEEGDLDLAVDEELRAKILEALKESGVDEDEDDGDDADDGGEEEEELLNDDQMMELDDKLAEIFRQRKSASKSAKDAAEASHNAQLKVLDLLEIFAKQQGSNPLLLQAILPLFNAARRSGKEDLDIASKASRVLMGITSKAKDYPSVKDVQEVCEVMRGVHQGAGRAGAEDIENVAIATSLYLAKVALASSSDDSAQAVADVYASSLSDFLIKKSCRLRGRFFEAFINRYREAAWHLREPLLEACSEQTKTSDKHRRTTCFHLLSTLLESHAALKSAEEKQDTIDLTSKYVQVFIDTFKAATEGKGMALQVARLREILKDCNKAIRASRIALKDGPKNVTLASLWQHTELTRVLTEMTQSTKIDKANSLGKFVRPVIDAIRQGSGTAKMSKVIAQQNGETSSGQSKKVKVRAEKADPGERPSKKAKGKKQDKGAKASEALLQSIAEEHGASTSEDSD